MPRVGAAPENLMERIALRANLAPWPVVDSMFAPPLGRVIQVAARTGMFERLARSPASAESLAGALSPRRVRLRRIPQQSLYQATAH